MYRAAIEAFVPSCPQEAADKAQILALIAQYPDTILTRENTLAHLTSSAFVVNQNRDKILMAHHNLYNTWAWLGGHADGDPDLPAVAVREAEEEAGITGLTALDGGIHSLDILAMFGHVKRENYVTAHLHLSVAYVYIAEESAPIRARDGENTAVRWIPADRLEEYCPDAHDIRIYRKLLARAAESIR
ncbi:NUDIX hydrolase [Ruminococcaceae bacterium OttesenSCG-928-L11]|nr:NUDIX hydrolase [Ruminococcaceae bacterium OttesenSCG-928-L11]